MHTSSEHSLTLVLLLSAACTPLLPGDETLRELDASAPSQPDSAVDAAPSLDAAEVADAAEDAGREPTVCPAPGLRARRLYRQHEAADGLHLSCQDDHEIEGPLVVTGGTLRIDPGVRIFARDGAFILVGRNARIEALGTEQAPIVIAPAERPAVPGAFRGLFVLGLADTALPNSATLALPAGDARAYYGGDDDEHDCGVLRHVRIEFAGGAANEYDFPAAGLTLAACGRRTQVTSVQVHGGTDGIGLIGGTVPLKRVLVSAPAADGIEWAAGYRGLIQFAVVQTFHGSGAALKGSNAFADPNALPSSAPVVANATLVGASAQGLPTGPSDANGFETGIQLQAGTGVQLENSLIYGFPGAWLDVVSESTPQNVGSLLRIAHTTFADPAPRTRPGFPGAGPEAGEGEDDDGGFSEDGAFRDPALQNRFPNMLLSLRDPFAAPPARPDFSADSFVDGGSLLESAPAGWSTHWEPAFYAGALPKIQFEAERSADWTHALGSEEQVWNSYPQE